MTAAELQLLAVKHVTMERELANEAWKDSIRKASAAGASLRDIGRAAGVSHVRVLQIVRE